MPLRMLVRWSLALLGFASASPVRSAPGPFALGANFNENLHAARVPALDLTGVTWVRGFLPACEFIDGARRLATDEKLATFHAAAASGRRIALSLKWDFKKFHVRTPAPGSPHEAACFAWALDVVQVGRPNMLLLVNELFIDTDAADLLPDASGAIPMVRFLQRLAAHVAAAGLRTPDSLPLPVSCGGFTRLDRPDMQTHAATRAMLPWLATTADLTHVNFHLHQLNLDQLASALDFIRTIIPQRPFVVTEFSLVWNFGRHLEDPLGDTEAGQAFARHYRRDPTSTVRGYLSAAAAKPVPEEELHAFLRSRAWFDPQFLAKACELLARHGVTLATYAYLQESSGLERARSPIPKGGAPWRLNAIFQERHALVPGETRPAHQLGFYDTFVALQKPRQP